MSYKSFQNKKVVLIPVETEVRELDYKIMLATEIADEDTICFVGQHNLLNKLINNFYGGVYLGKNIFPEWFPTRMDYYHTLKENDFSLLYYHEEGGIWIGEEPNWEGMCKKQIDVTILSNDDKVICWGPFQKNFYQSLESDASIHNVGVARFDLAQDMNLRRLISQSTKVQDKDYILINTNFAAVNHYLDFLGWFKPLNISSRSLDQRIETMHWYNSSFKVMGFFLEMLTNLLSDFPESKFVLRPHPTESIEFYEEFFKAFNNIKISKDFSAPEWINGCKALIQNGCTTSIEAHMMNKTVISYYPVESKNYVDVTKDIGHYASTYEDVKSLVDNLDNLQKDCKENYKLSSLVNNFTSNKSSISALANLTSESLKIKKKNKIYLSSIKLQAFIHHSLISIKELSRLISFSKRKNIDMFKSHFPGFQKAEILEKCAIASDIVGGSHNVDFVTKDLFIISK
jgi:surface carbohydrate biosynthesis protein